MKPFSLGDFQPTTPRIDTVNDNAASASTQLAISTPEDRARQALGFESAKAAQEAQEKADQERRDREAEELVEAQLRAAAAEEHAVDDFINNTAAEHGEMTNTGNREDGWYFSAEQLHAFAREIIAAVHAKEIA